MADSIICTALLADMFDDRGKEIIGLPALRRNFRSLGRDRPRADIFDLTEDVRNVDLLVPFCEGFVGQGGSSDF